MCPWDLISKITNRRETIEILRASAKNRKVRQVFINIGDPSMAGSFRVLLSNGYFFGGCLPRCLDTDGLLPQKLTGAPNL